MNSLQELPTQQQVFVSLNPRDPIPEESIVDEFVFAHPQFDRNSVAAVEGLKSIQGKNSTWYCGAWTGYGFHEDGLASAVTVAKEFGISPSWKLPRQ